MDFIQQNNIFEMHSKPSVNTNTYFERLLTMCKNSAALPKNILRTEKLFNLKQILSKLIISPALFTTNINCLANALICNSIVKMRHDPNLTSLSSQARLGKVIINSIISMRTYSAH